MLLRLYPPAFRERFGEAMQQTCNDLCSEREHQTGRIPAAFLLWLFVETAAAIIKEHASLCRPGDAMKNFFAKLRPAAIVSFLLVLPFMILEFAFNLSSKLPSPGFKYAIDSAVLFGLLWLLPTAGLAMLMPLVRNLARGDGVAGNPVRLAARVVFSAVLVVMWGGIVLDQFPCFFGLPNCD